MGDEADLACYKQQIRKELSLEAVRNQARVLLDRLSDLGEGAAAAARTRTEGGCWLRRRSGGG